jgi:uncharacterized Zn finger protein (UPF0148 family)
MPNQYREKECPSCGISHRKRGLYCCQSCANSDRTVSEDQKKKIKKTLREYHNSPEGLANAQRQSVRASAMNNDQPLPVTLDDFAVDIPELREAPDLDGYDKAENW